MGSKIEIKGGKKVFRFHREDIRCFARWRITVWEIRSQWARGLPKLTNNCLIGCMLVGRLALLLAERTQGLIINSNLELVKLDDLENGSIDSDAVFCIRFSFKRYMVEYCSFVPEKFAGDGNCCPVLSSRQFSTLARCTLHLDAAPRRLLRDVRRAYNRFVQSEFCVSAGRQERPSFLAASGFGVLVWFDREWRKNYPQKSFEKDLKALKYFIPKYEFVLCLLGKIDSGNCLVQ